MYILHPPPHLEHGQMLQDVVLDGGDVLIAHPVLGSGAAEALGGAKGRRGAQERMGSGTDSGDMTPT